MNGGVRARSIEHFAAPRRAKSRIAKYNPRIANRVRGTVCEKVLSFTNLCLPTAVGGTEDLHRAGSHPVAVTMQTRSYRHAGPTAYHRRCGRNGR